jgi:hypothetical protein
MSHKMRNVALRALGADSAVYISTLGYPLLINLLVCDCVETRNIELNNNHPFKEVLKLYSLCPSKLWKSIQKCALDSS